MTRIASRPPPRPAADRTPAVKADTRKQLKATFEKLTKAGTLEFGKAPAGDSYVRVPLKAGKGDQYSYTALIPTGGKSKDPNKADGFLIERSGGLAGRKQVAGPFTFEGKTLGKPAPFFEKFLEKQKNAGEVTTMRYPSDNESVDTKPTKPGGTMTTMRYPSDNESVDTKPTKPGGTMTTMRFPSDNEDNIVR